MRPLDLADRGTPDARSPHRYLWWLARGQWRLLAVHMAYSTLWMLSQALIPTALGAAIGEGIVGADSAALTRWTLVVLGLAVAGAAFGTLTHRSGVNNWMHATYRTMQVVGEHTVAAGPALPREAPTGEVVSVIASDASRIGNLTYSAGQLVGAVGTYAVVAVILLSRDTTLGLIVLLGVPLVTLVLATVLRPLQRRQNAAREASGRLTTLGSDTVTGLRVLRGIGGEETFLKRYHEQSAEVWRRGCSVAPVHATLDAARALLPGIFVVTVTWQGARLVEGGTLAPGDLIVFYGTAAFLAIPLRSATHFVSQFIRAQVGAQKVIRLLAVRSDLETTATSKTGGEAPAAPAPAVSAELFDPISGLRITPGAYTAVVTTTPQQARALADRLGRLGPRRTEVTWGGTALADIPIADVRARIVVADTDATLFTGNLREALTSARTTEHGEVSEADLSAAIEVASAGDVLDALPQRLHTTITERGRSFSGGQRQRLALVRALLSRAEVLLLIEPTSAVDAHTEARIGARLAAARAGMCTVVFTTSPLLLNSCEVVHVVAADNVVASGTHADLLAAHEGYADIVLRGGEELTTDPDVPHEAREGALR